MNTTLDNLFDDTIIKNPITINHIFLHNNNWETYKYKHSNIRPIEMEEVEKMLHCKDMGFRVFQCPKCNDLRIIHFGCNSRVCTHCGKAFADKWAEAVAESAFDVKHRHIVLTIPEELRHFFKGDRTLLKVLMDCAIRTISDVMKWKLHTDVIPGIIVVLHTYGKDMKTNPHLHSLVTEGGFKCNGGWVDLRIFPYAMLRKSWQYQLLTGIKKEIPDTPENKMLIDRLFKEHPSGFYVRAKDTISNKNNLMRYIGRYIRHPAIAESRICGYDGNSVTFWYFDDDKNKHYVTMSVDEFISAVLGHIPNKEFKTIRHYGIYSRGLKRKFSTLLGLVSMECQKTLKSYGVRSVICTKCGTKMKLVLSVGRKRPPDRVFGNTLDDWKCITNWLD